jgi:hypothetical protein
LKEDGFCGIDFDNAIVNGTLHPEVINWLKFFPTYQELSVSGTGVHAIGKGQIRKARTATALLGAPGVTAEMYDHDRFFVYTGARLSSTPGLTRCQESVEKLWTFLGHKTDDAAEPASVGAENVDDADRPLPLSVIRKLHQDNLAAFRAMKKSSDSQNDALNASAFFAARAFAAGVFEQTDEEQIKDELRQIAIDSKHCDGIEETLRSGWSNGIVKPLRVVRPPNDPLRISTPEEAFAYFNENFFVVEDYGGKVFVMWLEPDTHPGWEKNLLLGYQTQREFAQRYNHLKVEVTENNKIIHKPVIECWLFSKYREQYGKIVFAPGKSGTFISGKKRVKNLWQNFAVKARPGDCSLYLNFVRDVICSGNEKHYQELLNWMAYAVQHPDEPGHTAIALRGSKGTGKNFFA